MQVSRASKWIAVAALPLLLAACGTMGSGKRMSELTRDTISDKEFAGTWYVVANIPYLMERNRVAARVEYIVREDGRYRDLYIARKGSFDAPEKTLESLTWSLDPPRNSNWRTRYFGPLHFDWAVLDFNADRSVLVSGAPSRKYAWVFSRTPEIDDAAFEAALDVLERNGFDRTSIKRVPQTPADLGQPGFAEIKP